MSLVFLVSLGLKSHKESHSIFYQMCLLGFFILLNLLEIQDKSHRVTRVIRVYRK